MAPEIIFGEDYDLNADFTRCEVNKKQPHGIFNNSNFSDLLKSLENQSITPDDNKFKIVFIINQDQPEFIEQFESVQKKYASRDDISFYRIWTDLNEEWGLKPNAQVRFTQEKIRLANGKEILGVKAEPLPFVKGSNH